jgi:hypothetical protein
MGMYNISACMKFFCVNIRNGYDANICDYVENALLNNPRINQILEKLITHHIHKYCIIIIIIIINLYLREQKECQYGENKS